MKNRLLLILLGFVIHTYAQEAYYKLSINGEIGHEGSSCGEGITGGLQWIAVLFEDGSHKTLVQGSTGYPNNGNGKTNSTFSNSIKFYASNKVSQMALKTTHRERRRIGTCKSTSYADTKKSLTDCHWNTTFDFKSIGLNQPGHVKVNITPEITLLQPDLDQANLGSEDPFKIGPIEGVSSEYFNWEYSFDTNNWINFPEALNYSNQIDTKSKQLFPEDLFLNHGKRVYLRVNTGCNNSISNVISYTYMISAPKITGVTPTNVTCFDTNDGIATIKFDRALHTDELLSIVARNTISGEVYNATNISELDTTNSYSLTGLTTGEYSVELLGSYTNEDGNTFNTYTEGSTYQTSFTIDKPTPVAFSYTTVDVWCNQGTDGEIHLEATGGMGGYQYLLNDDEWTDFESPFKQSFYLLPPASYNIQVRDRHGCIAKEIVSLPDGSIALRNEITETPIINAPQSPVAIDFVYHKSPTGFGFSDGIITAQVTGGTPLEDGSYNFTWIHENGTVWNSFSQEVTPDGWFISLKDGIDGNYFLTVTDKHFDAATHSQGCTIVEAQFELIEPDLLTLSIEETHHISCNDQNLFVNPFNDGQLTTTADGGVKFQPPIDGKYDYKYTWKQKDASGIYQILEGENAPVLDQIVEGDYSVNIEDANGIVVGSLSNNIVTPIDVTYTITQPEILEVTVSHTDLSCNADNNAQATAHITGGTPPYHVQWSNGVYGTENKNLIAGNYVVYITDSYGCDASEEVTVNQPETLQIHVDLVDDPDCFGGNDGAISLSIEGGTPPYTYAWNTGATTSTLENLSAGTYTFSLNDAMGCATATEITLTEPDPLTIELGPSVYLCADQSVTLEAYIDDPEASYFWNSSGFVSFSPSVTLNESGTYQVLVTSSLGCQVSDSIEIFVSEKPISADFIMPVHAHTYEQVKLIDISDPYGETHTWLLPNEHVRIVEELDTSALLTFDQAGTYEIGLETTQGYCSEILYKSIVIEEASVLPSAGDTPNPFIENFNISPNPNQGIFEVTINLAKSAYIGLRIYDMQGNLVYTHPDISDATEFKLPMNLALATGMYFIVLETAQETEVKSMSVQ